MLNGLDLFSGIGGITLALQEWVRPIAYCEIDLYCQGVILSRISERTLPYAPIWDDIRTLKSSDLPFRVDIIYGGFPCQDISIAGNGKGLEGKRSRLFYEIVRVSNEIKPRWLFLENVPAITARGGFEVVQEITKMGYDCRWITITASSLGAIHERERWFLLAHSNSKSKHRLCIREKKKQPFIKLHPEYKEWKLFPENESALLRMDDELPFRMDRTRSLGNSVVPAQAKEAFKILMGINYLKNVRVNDGLD